MNRIDKYSRLSTIALFLGTVHPVFAYSNIADGSVRYDLGIGELAEMTTEIVAGMGYVVMVLYALAMLIVLYNAMVIYVKMQTGEQGITKSVLTLFGAIFFLIGATIILPSFFGYNAMNGWGHF